MIESQTDRDIYRENMVISYRLNDGSLFTREYRLPIELMKNDITPIMEAESYKRNLPEFSQLQDDILTIRVVPSGPVRGDVMITDPNEIAEFTAVIKKQLLSQTIDELIRPRSPWGYIELSYKDSHEKRQFEGYSISWQKSFDEISNWLDEHDYLEDARIDSEDILKAEVTKVDNQDKRDIYIPDELFHHGKQFITITDKDDISNVLQTFTDHPDKHTYYIKLYLKDGTNWYGSIPNEAVPDEIKKQFK